MSEATGQLGTIVSWRVPKEVTIAELRDGLKTAGIDPAMAADMNPQNALKRALREMKEGRVIRQLRREGDLVWFQFTQEHLGKTEVTYNKEAELSLNTETGAVYCSVLELQQEATRLLEEHKGKRLTSDLTRLVQRVYDEKAADLIPIREQGGAYFVPEMHREVVDKSRTLLSEIGGSLRSFDVRLGSADTSASVAESLNEYLLSMIDDFEKSCEEVTGDSTERVINNRKGSAAEIRQRMECYQGILGAWSDSLKKRLQDSETELLKKIAIKTEDEQPEEPPEEEAADSTFTPFEYKPEEAIADDQMPAPVPVETPDDTASDNEPATIPMGNARSAWADI